MSKTAWMTVVALHLRACIVSTLTLALFRTTIPLVFMLSLEYLQGRWTYLNVHYRNKVIEDLHEYR